MALPFGMTLIIGILFLVVVVLIAVFVRLYNKEEEVGEDLPFVINFAKPGVGAYGYLKDKIKSPIGRREIITLVPKDISHKDIIDKKEIKPQSFIVEKGKDCSLPRGSFSPGKNIFILLPKHAMDFSEEFLNTEIGSIFAFYTEYLNADNVVKEAMLEGMRRMSSHIRDMGEGEVSIDALEKIKSLSKDAVEMLKETRRERTSFGSSIPPPANPF